MDLVGEPVPWVIDPAERCGDCLLISDEDVTARLRVGLVAAKPLVLESMDAALDEFAEQSERAQITDMIAEGSPTSEDES